MHFLRRDFSFPAPLETALREYFWQGRNPVQRDIESLAAPLNRLWPVLAKGRGQGGDRHYSFDGNFARAYAAYYLSANLMKVPLILEEMRMMGLRLPESETLRWMDVGSGPGTALWGLSWWAACRERNDVNLRNIEFLGLEQSLHFLKIARELAGCLKPQVRVAWEAFRHTGAGGNAGERLRQTAKSLPQWIRSTRPHVVSIMNSIGEIAPEAAARAELVGALFDELVACEKADGTPRWLILIEPGTQAASRELLELRETLRARADLRVWLPCLSARPCGALAKGGDWCHEEAACTFPDWFDKLGAAAGMRKESVLFSYLVVSTAGVAAPVAWPADGMRVVSQRMKEKGLTQCYLCTEAGKHRVRVLDSRRDAANEALCDAVRGQIFEKVEFDEKGNVMSLKQLGNQPEPKQDAEAKDSDDGLTVFPKLPPGRRS